jgi:hypothetical protein
MTAGPMPAREAAFLSNTKTTQTAQADGYSQTGC